MSVPTANVEAIWPAKPDPTTNGTTGMQQAITLAANDYTGINANYQLVHTAGADGSIIEGIKFTPAGTNVATVMRIFINNGSAQTTATNNTFVGEISLQATTASATAALTSPEFYFPRGAIRLPSGFRIYVGLATAVAAGWVPSIIAGGQY